MKYLVILNLVFLAIIVKQHSCDAYEYLYDQDDGDLSWLYGNALYGQGYREFLLNGDFDDYIPNSYRKSVRYQPQPITSYQPSSYFVDSGPQLNDQWNDEPPLYVTYETLPRIQKQPVYFIPPTTEAPPPTNGYHYPTPQTQYLPPSKRPITFFQPKQPPKALYLPPTKIPTTATPHTTATRTTTLKPSTPKSSYLPPIVVPEPEAPETEYLPPLSSKLQPPPISSEEHRVSVVATVDDLARLD